MTNRYYVRSNTIIDREDKLNNMERILSPSEACERLNNLKEQIIIYEEFLKGNDLDIEWDLFCTADVCEEEEDMDCKYCKYMRWKE